MYVTKPRLFFDYALRNRFAFPSFNVCNLEIARSVIVAAEEENAPQMARVRLSVMGASHHAKPLWRKLQEEREDLSALKAKFFTTCGALF
jgi:fructose/tagatose bisphosphate aldolase